MTFRKHRKIYIDTVTLGTEDSWYLLLPDGHPELILLQDIMIDTNKQICADSVGTSGNAKYVCYLS